MCRGCSACAFAAASLGVVNWGREGARSAPGQHSMRGMPLWEATSCWRALVAGATTCSPCPGGGGGRVAEGSAGSCMPVGLMLRAARPLPGSQRGALRGAAAGLCSHGVGVQLHQVGCFIWMKELFIWIKGAASFAAVCNKGLFHMEQWRGNLEEGGRQCQLSLSLRAVAVALWLGALLFPRRSQPRRVNGGCVL